MKSTKTILRIFAIAILPALWCGVGYAGASVPALLVPELDPGTASGGIALAAVAAILLIERYRSR